SPDAFAYYKHLMCFCNTDSLALDYAMTAFEWKARVYVLTGLASQTLSKPHVIAGLESPESKKVRLLIFAILIGRSSCYRLQTIATTCTGFVAVCLLRPICPTLCAKKWLIVYMICLRRVPHDSAEPEQ